MPFIIARVGGCPHARGGEPDCLGTLESRLEVVPTPVGVNRGLTYLLRKMNELSPRPWG